MSTHRMRIFEIKQTTISTEQFPVHYHWKMNIQNNTVIDCQTQQQTNQCELIMALK